MISALSNVFRRRYMLDGRVGKGGFSSAWKAIDLATGRLVAVKFLLNPEITVNRDDAFKELKFMSGTNHPNILKCLDTMTIQGDPVIVTEFAQGGDLWHYLASGFPYGVSNDIAKRMFRQIMEGLGYLHSKDVVHRDLKPLNILVFENNHVKLADFGHSTQIPADHHGYVPHVPCTPTPIRDEQAIRDWILAKPCDVWSAGVCLYELLAGKEPFHILTGDDGHKGLHRRIRRGDFQFDDQALWGGREDLAVHLIARMMNPDPHKRPTAEQVLTHPWLTGDLTRQGMLDFVGLRVPHAQKPESFNSQGPEWIARLPRIRLRAPWIEGLEEFPPLSRQRRADGSFSEELEEFRLTEVDWSAPAPGYRL
ncbi:kinase-like domain-containing protein [Cadophora sp. MPI-SDFR-AT-0126]|nr:kinase-like domain-containing protein [Leotiomycetes sp. MPI-SDFR-AT-0126]